MRVPSLRNLAALAALSTTTFGCALFAKSDPVVLRYFTPEALAPSPAALVTARGTGFAGADLRLGRINSASYLKDRIAFRDQNFEIGYYERLRWTEKPEAYLRRALGRVLYQERGIRQIISGPGPTLDVDLDAFEELQSPRHAARIQLTWVLHDDQHVQLQETLTIERPIHSSVSGDPAPIASAMAGAFDEAVRGVATRVIAALPKTTTSPATVLGE